MRVRGKFNGVKYLIVLVFGNFYLDFRQKAPRYGGVDV
jgi:hypothetical protein